MNFREIIQEIYKKQFNKTVRTIKDVSIGEDNYVFIIDSEQVIRFPIRSDKDLSSEAWALDKLNTLKFVPKLILYDDSKKLFTKDYLIESRIEGKDAQTAIDKKEINTQELKKIIIELGKSVKILHKIHTPFYGHFINGVGIHKEWKDFLRSNFIRAIEYISEKSLIDSNLINTIKKYCLDQINNVSCEDPRLLHGDLNLDNIIDPLLNYV